jgi:hypothetical protein
VRSNKEKSSDALVKSQVDIGNEKKFSSTNLTFDIALHLTLVTPKRHFHSPLFSSRSFENKASPSNDNNNKRSYNHLDRDEFTFEVFLRFIKTTWDCFHVSLHFRVLNFFFPSPINMFSLFLRNRAIHGERERSFKLKSSDFIKMQIGKKHFSK